MSRQGVERMAALWWSSREYELSEASEGIGEVLGGIAQGMKNGGWEGVAVGGDVHGYKPGIDFFAAVQYLPIGGRKFWQVIAVGGDGKQAQATSEIDGLQSIIDSLKFL
ncbi:MAG: hypothetical protein JF587_16000 [Catenulisporales bacterium]|nr:hypothetical protein [Catenulisporales bacterium]